MAKKKLSKVIAKNIKKNCKEINTTLELVEIIKVQLVQITFTKIILKEKYFKPLELK